MTLDDVIVSVQSIKEIADDDEAAHGAEDALYKDFVRHVARVGPPDLAKMAEKILTTDEIKFSRWRA